MTRCLLLVLTVTLCGCGGWSWRLPGFRYPAAEVTPEVAGGGLDADLGPEAYPVAVWEGTAGTWGQIQAQLADEGRRKGAHAVLLEDWHATVSQTTMVHTPSQTDAGIVTRRELVDQQASSVSVRALALRRPALCLGLTLQCLGDDCSRVVVQRVRLSSPAEAAGLVPGDWVVRAAGVPVEHPWDVHQRADKDGDIVLSVLRDEGGVDVTATPVDCDSIYEAATR